MNDKNKYLRTEDPETGLRVGDAAGITVEEITDAQDEMPIDYESYDAETGDKNE